MALRVAQRPVCAGACWVPRRLLFLLRTRVYMLGLVQLSARRRIMMQFTLMVVPLAATRCLWTPKTAPL